MNVYDFDNTIYDGESAVDFFMFCIKYSPRIISLLPLLIIKLIKYKMCLITIEELEKYVEKYSKKMIDSVDNVTELVDIFWDKNFKKIKKFYLNQKSEDDVIISASFDFLLRKPIEMLGIKTLICSEIDTKTGAFTKMCFHSNKVERIREVLKGDEHICFYTDSMNDKPMIELAQEAYLVKGNKITLLK